MMVGQAKVHSILPKIRYVIVYGPVRTSDLPLTERLSRVTLVMVTLHRTDKDTTEAGYYRM